MSQESDQRANLLGGGDGPGTFDLGLDVWRTGNEDRRAVVETVDVLDRDDVTVLARRDRAGRRDRTLTATEGHPAAGRELLHDQGGRRIQVALVGRDLISDGIS